MNLYAYLLALLPVAWCSFTYNATHFLLDGSPFQIIGGQMDPQRIPYQYWRSRLRLARSMGLNTIFSYVFWDDLEPTRGVWRSSTDPENNVAEYFRQAHEEGLYVVLRPGPYICGEHEWGGLPAWLSTVPNMTVRANNAAFLEASKSYFENLARDLAPLQITKGGPILMVQVENEFGSYASDHAYTSAVKDMLKEKFDVPLYTNDGPLQKMLEDGSVPGVLAETDGGPAEGFEARDKYITDPTRLGPQLDGEYYTLWPDQWGSNLPHKAPTENDVAGFVKDLDYTLGNRSSSISLYMVHGGTNWGFKNGALWQNKTVAWTTSYDYGSPISENGRTNFYFNQLRETISKYVPPERVPEVPENIPMMAVDQFDLVPRAPLFDTTEDIATKSESPKSMEQLGQAYGYVLYRYLHPANSSQLQGVLQPGDRARDRVLVYINGKRSGVIDSQYTKGPEVNVTLRPGDKMELLVENLGRVNYYSQFGDFANHIVDPYKGIVGDVRIGTVVLHGWEMQSFPIEQVPQPCSTTKSDTPMFYSGTFDIASTVQSSHGAEGMDTYLAVTNGVRGNVWVNGFHLGRYWTVGPQQSLYLPGTLLRPTGNEVVVLELEPSIVEGHVLKVAGLADRKWYNQADPDCEGCS